jgi:aminopeptidase N
MKDGLAGKSIFRKDYEAYPWDVKQLQLFFDIGRETTTVRAEMKFHLKDAVKPSQDIVLNGKDLELLSL